MKMPTYEEFRTGLTFRTVRQLLWSGSDDPKDWKYKRRNTVLGFWHQLKQQLYQQLIERWEDTNGTNDSRGTAGRNEGTAQAPADEQVHRGRED